MRIAGEINTAFKVAIIERWGTQIECERETGIRQGSLSQLQRNYRAPYPVELVRLRKFFSDAQLRRFFGKAAVRKISRISNEVGSDLTT